MSAINKKDLTERDICTKFITPALQQAGWDILRQVREEVSFTAGRVMVRGKLTARGERKRADYILSYKSNLRIALIEAKDNRHSVGAGMQQALGYAETLDIPFVYTSNGDAFLERDRTATSGTIEREIPLDAFPSPEELWRRYCRWKGIDTPQQERIVTQDYYSDGSGKQPRYYQLIAINRTLEAIAEGRQRLLLVMATGTGKTYTAFQIIWRLWKSKAKKRILFLADRNILVDQTKTNDFRPFGSAMTKIENRQVDTSYEIYLSLYQAITGVEEASKIYKQFSPDFFDLIIIDECHRGSAAEDSAWREILEYFTSATQIGLTATPKETKYVSNINYFGEPIYTYSLRQGIEDGFLAPYKVVRIDLDRDLAGWRPERGQVDRYGNEIADRIYGQQDFDRTLVLEERIKLVAAKITEFLRATDPMGKTIVFCEDIDHAERMRQALVNANSEQVVKNGRYVMRITGDSAEGKAELDNFILPDSSYPVIVTTSKLLTTGVDAQTCRLIVLDRTLQSMTEFKQIIGRGTRIHEEQKKFFFTIMDFRKATELFADPTFDGDPVQIFISGANEPPVPPDDDDETPDEPEAEEQGRLKYVVDNVTVKVVAERVQYYSRDGKLITESLKDYTRKAVHQDYASLNDFLTRWSQEERKAAVIAELEEHGVLLEALAEQVGKDYDPFDLVCHVAFDQPLISRRQRADEVRRRNFLAQYSEQVRAVLDVLLEKYADAGIEDLETMDILTVPQLKPLGTMMEIVSRFGGKPAYQAALRQLKHELYRAA